MEFIEYNISSAAIVRLIVFSIFVFSLFRLINYALNHIKNKSTTLKLVAKNILLVELFTWILFLIWAANSARNRNPILSLSITGILLFILFWVSYFGLKNIIAGVFFRYQENYAIGDHYQNNEYSGRIINFKLFALRLESKEGQIISIPYGKLVNKVSTHQEVGKTITAYTFELNTSKEKEIQEVTQEIKSILLSMAWISTHRTPEIHQLKTSESAYHFSISLFAINNDYALKTEQLLKSKFTPSPINKAESI
jgi:small-conductance mechanosensitive channel